MLTADFATLAANPSLFTKLSYDGQKDFAPVGMLARFPLLLVVAPNVPVKNFKEFLAWAQANKDGTNYASAGTGSPHHLATELLRERTGLKLVHTPYRGAAPAVQDLMGGQVPFGLMDSASVQQYVTAGKLRAIGVASLKRSAVLPEVPTIAEQGMPQFEAVSWYALMVPAATPKAIVDKLHAQTLRMLAKPETKEKFAGLGLESGGGTPQAAAATIQSETVRWADVIRKRKITAD